ncbi:MAG: hypothetical protein Q8O91_08650 [Candidatus Aminicenantes bacterium]|nr:hypothetical protein [Candidatus Aminicenantes bacterium]
MPKAEIYTWDGMPARITKERSPQKIYKLKKKKSRKKLSDKGIRSLTKKQHKALTNYMEQGMTGQRKALVAAGYSGFNPNRDMKRLMVRKPIIAYLQKKGITDEKIADIIAQGIDAMHVIKGDKPDHHARIKFVSEANRILDNYPATKFQSEERIITINLTEEDTKNLQKFRELSKTDAQD